MPLDPLGAALPGRLCGPRTLSEPGYTPAGYFQTLMISYWVFLKHFPQINRSTLRWNLKHLYPKEWHYSLQFQHVVWESNQDQVSLLSWKHQGVHWNVPSLKNNWMDWWKMQIGFDIRHFNKLPVQPLEIFLDRFWCPLTPHSCCSCCWSGWY